MVGHTRLQLNVTAPFADQLAEVVAYVNRLTTDRLPIIDKRIDAVEKDIEQVTTDLTTAQSELRAHIGTRVAELRKELDMTQVVDLRWAIVGLIISAFGILLSY